MNNSNTTPQHGDGQELHADILRWCLSNDTGSEPTVFNVREFADQHRYDYQRVRDAVDELYPLLEYGSGAGAPWVGYDQLPTIRKQLEEWSGMYP